MVHNRLNHTTADNDITIVEYDGLSWCHRPLILIKIYLKPSISMRRKLRHAFILAITDLSRTTHWCCQFVNSNPVKITSNEPARKDIASGANNDLVFNHIECHDIKRFSCSYAQTFALPDRIKRHTLMTPKHPAERVRQALLYALDRDSIVNDILLGYAEVAQGTQPVVSYAYAPDDIATKYTYDPEKAKSLLAEAGWTDSDGDGILDKDGEALSFEFLYPAGSPTSDQMVSTSRMPGARSGSMARRAPWSSRR